MTRLFLLLAAGLAASAAVAAPSAGPEDAHLAAFFDREWQWRLSEFPELATSVGDHRFDDRLADESEAAHEKRFHHAQEALKELERIPRDRLTESSRLSWDLFRRNLRESIEAHQFPAWRIPIGPLSGPHMELPELVSEMRFGNAADYETYLRRLAAIPVRIDQLVALMEAGIASKWVPAAPALRRAPDQIEALARMATDESPFFAPFRKIPQRVSAADRDRLEKAGREAVSGRVLPAFARLAEFLRKRYLPALRRDDGAWALPDGEAYYAFQVKHHTTTDMTPRQIHELGLAEVARIRKDMDAVISETGFRGSFGEFLTHLRTDPRFYFTDAEALVEKYRDIAKRIDPELPRFFGRLPRNPYGVKVIPPEQEASQTTAYYQPGAADGSRPGYYMVNTYRLETRPKYEMEALTLHESVPGHHLQISLAQEQTDLPEFRRHAGYNAFVEGWALYAESLGKDIGLYRDPYSRFGALTYEMWRACRLVVDTGMHAMRWDRQKAVDFMKANTAKSENDIGVEVDRYISWPGQALAYKIGQRKILELADRARAALSEKFDIRAFHDAVLGSGALPLDVLERQIDAWIAARRR
jgi:uncharacterized protein (DUF885 family)